MLNDLLKEIKKAQENGDKKTEAKCKKILNKCGVDNFTICELLKEI